MLAFILLFFPFFMWKVFVYYGIDVLQVFQLMFMWMFNFIKENHVNAF